MSQNSQDPAIGAIVITKSDTDDIFKGLKAADVKGLYRNDGGSNSALVQDSPFATRAIYVGGAGDVNVVMANGTTVLFSAVPAGTLLPIAATRVMSASTTATLMLGLY